MRLICALAVLAACSKPSPNCQRAVRHVFDVTVNLSGPGEKPLPDEQKMIDAIEEQALGRCNSEGLSDEQRDCILAAKTLVDRTFLTCPALVAKPPSWIQAPIGHPEVLDEYEKLKKQIPEEEPVIQPSDR